jgi:hypothetical protein
LGVPAVREPLPELCPPREMLESYARGGRDPVVAGHISRCDPCAWIVTQAMESEPPSPEGEVIDITPRPGWWARLCAWFQGQRRTFTRP